MAEHKAIDFLIAALDGVKPVRGEWKALCPAHNDTVPSLYFGPGDVRGFLAHCFAGCRFEAVADACKLPLEYRRGVTEFERIYTYVDENGTALRQVLRKRGEGFLQRSWDIRGDVVWSVKGVRNVLYDLRKVRASVGRGDTIWVTEGERDAETLKDLKLVATTAPGGAEVTWASELIEPLRGASRIVIVADCDDVGRRAAWKRHALICEIADDVRVIDVSPGRRDGYDVSDWFVEGGTKEALLRLADEAPSEAPLESVAPSVATDIAEKVERRHTKLYDDISARSDLEDSEKLVYSYVLRDLEMRNNRKYHGRGLDMSTRAIADRFHLSRRTIQTAFVRLEALGFIVTERTNGGRQKRNSYAVIEPMPLHMAQPLRHIRAEVPSEPETTNGATTAPQMAQPLRPHIQRTRESSITQKKNDSTISEVEEQSETEKNPEKKRMEKLACGHALPWVHEAGETNCMGCNPPPGLNVIKPTAEAVRAFVESVTTSEWPFIDELGRPEGWK